MNRNLLLVYMLSSIVCIAVAISLYGGCFLHWLGGGSYDMVVRINLSGIHGGVGVAVLIAGIIAFVTVFHLISNLIKKEKVC